MRLYFADARFRAIRKSSRYLPCPGEPGVRAEAPPRVCAEIARLANQGKLEQVLAVQREQALPAPAGLEPLLTHKKEYHRFFGRFEYPGESRDIYALEDDRGWSRGSTSVTPRAATAPMEGTST
ncbi:MAG: hypothetical protein ABI769_15885 [Pseudomonadota bacterium]